MQDITSGSGEMIRFVRRCGVTGMNIELCYETFGDSCNPCLLLIGGLNMQLYAWDEEFCDGLAARGYFVVRFDNRDIGHSTKIDGSLGSSSTSRDGTDAPDVSENTGCARLARTEDAENMTRERTIERSIPHRQNELRNRFKITAWKLLLPKFLCCLVEDIPYHLEDMAEDAFALLDLLGVQRSHLLGVSMGGMIAQQMSILHPQRVLTMTNIMSSTGSGDLPHPALWVKLSFLRRPKHNTRQGILDFRTKSTQAFVGMVPVDEGYLRSRISLSLDRSSYTDGLTRHAAAIVRATPREEKLKRVLVPSLIIHGACDPLCPVEHGYRLAAVLTNSKLIVCKNMGHYFNPAFFRTVTEEFCELAARSR
jgi:pimeloyl-ACP methyl ester carboxylesterase